MAGLPFGENQDAFLPHRGEGTVACEPVREAIGVFQDKPPLGAAVDDLLMSGFDRSEISVVVGRRRVGRDFGAAADHAAAWAYEPEAPSTAYVGNGAQTQAKAAIVPGLGYLGAMAAVYAVISSSGTVLAAAVGAGIAGILRGLVGGARGSSSRGRTRGPSFLNGMTDGMDFLNGSGTNGAAYC